MCLGIGRDAPARWDLDADEPLGDGEEAPADEEA